MTMTSLTELLNNTLAGDTRIIDAAQAQLDAYSKENFPQFISLLCQEFSNDQQQPHTRQAAGLLVKNQLATKNFERQGELTLRWLALEENLRIQIKLSVIQTLHSASHLCGTTAGQIIAAIANIELVQGMWLDLIPILLKCVKEAQTPLAKKCSLQCIGFLCESPQLSNALSSQSNAILTAIAEGARKEEQSDEVRYTALQALMNSLEFIRENFNREDERNYVMQIVCEATQRENSPEVQVIGFECLVKIVTIYYDCMSVYMEKALYGLTVMGMRHDNEKVVLQAIEFWSNICEIEYDRALAYQDGDTSSPMLGFATAAMSDITPVLLWVMTKQEEDDDADEWTPSMAAATCVQYLSNVSGSAIVPFVLPFIQENIQNPDWKFRDTACMVFGSIMDGPDPTEMGQLVSMALPVIIQLISDPVPNVKDTAAWTLGRICENLLEIIKPEEFEMIVNALITGLSDNPKIAANCCWGIISIAERLGKKSEDDQTCELSRYFEPLLNALMTAAQRPGQDYNFQQSAYEAVSILIESSTPDVSAVVNNLAQVVVQQLTASLGNLQNLVGDDEIRAHYQNQSNLCGIFTSVIHYNPAPIRMSADLIMQTLLSVISNASKNSTVKEEAYVAIGALAGAVEGDFIRYTDTLMPFIFQALSNHEDHAVCTIVLGIVGDICRALGDQVMPYCEPLINAIGVLLQSQEIHRKIRPACLSTIGDISLAIGGRFEVYVHPAMGIINEISNQLAYIPLNTNEQYDYIMDTREAIAEAYVGICQGLKQAEKGMVLINYAQQLFGFLETAAAEPDKEEVYVKAILGLLGDLADTIPVGHLKLFFGAEWVSLFLRQVKTDRNCSPDTKAFAKWVRELVRRQLA
ncbi:armadillo-type protein [Globomyces pollinis-pini]|nr:armadillo-type protein [Globomyces pollinis-pini]